MSKCHACKAEDAYYPFTGPVECINEKCEFYNEKHHMAIMNERKNNKEVPTYKEDADGQLGFDWDGQSWKFEPYNDDDGDILYATGYTLPSTTPSPPSTTNKLPSMNDAFKPYPSGPFKK